jgi:non-lysosomal glucosylceramidase
LDENLFNGEYYEHQVIAPQGRLVAEGLAWNMGAKDLSDPDLQLGSGCLVDQLFGQFFAHVCGLGHLAKRTNIQKTLESILRYNGKSDFYGHFNHMRSYVLNDESALVMASYPRGNRPVRPFPYFNEVMTGFEYVAAIGLLDEDQQEAGLKCIRAIRDRYDGRRRSPFNEAECGHHYARAMASWAAILALSGFHYSGVTGTVTFKATKGTSRTFWSTGYAWGTFSQTPGENSIEVELLVLGGTLKVKRLVLTDVGSADESNFREIEAEEKYSARLSRDG